MVDRSHHKIRDMFAQIAPRYDLLNRLLSLSIDRYWRRVARLHVAPMLPEKAVLLDLCTGTGDLAFEFARESRVIGCDFCHPMLVRGLEKSRKKKEKGAVSFVEGDALELPFRNGFFNGLTIAFGLRNLENYEAGIAEMNRVLAENGVLAILDFSEPRLPVFRSLYLFYFRRVLPLIGRLVSGKEGPYSYLPASVSQFPKPGEMCQLLERLGFGEVRHFPLTGGIAALYLGRKNVD